VEAGTVFVIYSPFFSYTIWQRIIAGKTMGDGITNTILIVDGDDDFRSFLLDFFKKREFEATGCADFEQAGKLVMKKKYDVVVVDYFIGNKSAGSLCDTIVANYQNSSALIITSDTQSNAIELSIRQHAPAFFFVKPFAVDNLYAVALKILQARDKRKLRTKNIALVC
jgi:DNA-binding response OmpR family regulator